MRHIRTTHIVTLHTPQAAGFQSIFTLHTDRAHIRHQRVRFHVHALARTGNVDFHHRVPLMHEVLLRKCILVCIRIRIDDKVLITGSRIRSCPKEVFPLLACGQFTGYPHVTVEHALHFCRSIVTVFILQH